MGQAIHKDLIFYELEADDTDSLIRVMGAAFEKAGFVKATYAAAVAERELVYPTGLQLDGVAVAMPHTTGEHVITPAIGVARLARPVSFSHMGDEETKVDAEFVFMMAIKNPDEQIGWLKSVMSVFTDAEALNEMKATGSAAALYEFAVGRLQAD
jgi:PTS system galactitol-specific IIA component